jgi:hypothetical protein
MAIANSNILLKKSGVTTVQPTSLEYGELALNYADGRLFYKNSNGAIDSFSSRPTIQTDSFSTISSNGSLLFATTPTDILTISPGTNISIATNTSSKTITINSNASSAEYTEAAFSVANNAVIRTGDTMTGNLVIGISTPSTSNSTGALVVDGGVGVSGNVSIGKNLTFSNTAGGQSGHIAFNPEQNSIDFLFF